MTDAEPEEPAKPRRGRASGQRRARPSGEAAAETASEPAEEAPAPGTAEAAEPGPVATPAVSAAPAAEEAAPPAEAAPATPAAALAAPTAEEPPPHHPPAGPPAVPGAKRRQRWRSPAVAVMLILAWVLTPISVAGVWMRNQVFDTNTYVDTVTPLATDPAVQSAVSNYITFLIFSHVDVQGKVTQILPGPLEPLAAPITAQVQSFVAGKVNDVVTSDQFPVLWETVNRAAHQQVVNFILGRPGAVGVSGGKLVINVKPILDVVLQRLQGTNLGFISGTQLANIDASFEIADASGLAKAQNQLRLFQGLTTILPFVTLALFAGAIALARDRRRALLFAAVGVAAGCLVLGVGLALARGIYLDSVTGPHLPQDAAAAIFDTVVRFLRDANRALFALALVIAIAAWVSGPSRSAVRTRAAARRPVDWFSGREVVAERGAGSVAVWASEHRNLLRGAVVAVAALVLLFWDRPTGLVVLVVALLALLAIAAVEVVATAGRRARGQSATTS